MLTQARLAELARSLDVSVAASARKAEQIEQIVGFSRLRFREILDHLTREELRRACNAHELPDDGRSRRVLEARLLEAHGTTESVRPKAIFADNERQRTTPKPRSIVLARRRQWMCESVVPPTRDGEATLVRLVCLDDDNAGRTLELFWELELGARVIQPEVQGLGEVTRIDEPRFFGAYLHALKWNTVTATDARLFQSPFRAGIKLLQHQLTPLKKALQLPRANLFIADDVGLGKTIEAGLVLQELVMRQRVDFTLIVCPASVALQWRDEMQKRFGLRFEIYNRDFVARRRQERGFAVSPWATHNRFIITYSTLRRAEYDGPLRAHMESLRSVTGENADGTSHRSPTARKSLLILDEAHTAAPATASKYAVDSKVTKSIRALAPRFENRLFLSATPHNGHSNSFSSLLEILDPQRFTRGVPITSTRELEPVMVRRLKSDLRAIPGLGKFPERKVVPVAVGSLEAPEVVLAAKLAEYAALVKPEKGRAKLVFIHLQKRLLSSVEAFARTLRKHAEAVAAGKVKTLAPTREAAPTLFDRQTEDDSERGLDDEILDAALDEEVAETSRKINLPAGRAHDLLSEMQSIAERQRAIPDAKAMALFEWIREHQCAGADLRLTGEKRSKAQRTWTNTRVIIFTEYADTLRWLHSLLAQAIEGTDDADERIMRLQGGMSDEQRAEVQRAFNGAPTDNPVRILLATDSAREGVNLQAQCADLFHFDIPWNPARMEQRNGRIDRTMQQSEEVRCHYFVYADRKEDAVLETLVRKVDLIQRELGSLGTVVLERFARALETGIDVNTTGRAIEKAVALAEKAEVSRLELETQRDANRLQEEITDIGKILAESKRALEFDPALLRGAIDAGLELSNAGGGMLSAELSRESGASTLYRLPSLPDSWTHTLDNLRPTRRREETDHEWRKRPLLPIVFEPPERIDDEIVHMHLEHPFVERILSRFRAQGFGAHDLSRVTVLLSKEDAVPRVIAFGRLTLFGRSAARLHDTIVAVAAPWFDDLREGHLRAFSEKEDHEAVARFEGLLAAHPTLRGVPSSVAAKLRASAAGDFATLWPSVKDEADSRAADAIRKLSQRATDETSSLKRILESQRSAIEKELGRRVQTELAFEELEKDQQRQFTDDRKHMQSRLKEIDAEILSEPAQLKSLYEVVLPRLEPVGLVYLWPETRA